MFYYFFITIWVGVTQSSPNKFFRSKAFTSLLLLIMFVVIFLIVLLNPTTTDVIRYLAGFYSNNSLSWIEGVSQSQWEPGFVTFQWIISKITLNNYVFIGITVTTMWLLLLFSLKKIILFKYLPLIMFGYFSFFYFYNFYMNILRQGLAVPFALLVIIFLVNKKYKKAILVYLLAITFHISSAITGVLFVIKRFNISIKTLILLYILSAGLMMSGLNESLMLKFTNLFGNVFSESINTYSSDSKLDSYGNTNRIDFLLFTTIWIPWALWFKRKYLKVDRVYDWILKSYISLSIIFLLFAFVGYSDRIAAFSWMLIPILLFYPITKMESKFKVLWLLLGILISVVMFIYFDTYLLYEPLKLFY